MKRERCGAPCGVDRDLVDERFPEIGQRIEAAVITVKDAPVSGPKLSIDELMELLAEKTQAPANPERAKEDRQIESLAPACECGGNFRLNARSRCPSCRSDNYRKDPNGVEMHVC